MGAGDFPRSSREALVGRLPGDPLNGRQPREVAPLPGPDVTNGLSPEEQAQVAQFTENLKAKKKLSGILNGLTFQEKQLLQEMLIESLKTGPIKTQFA